MKTMKFARSAAILTAVGVVASASAASASSVIIEGSYTLSYQASVGNAPKLTDDLSDPFKLTLTVGTPSSVMNFFTASPASTCGTGCAHTNPTASGTITASFSFQEVTIVNNKTTVLGTGTLSEQAIYSADYFGQLACSQSTGKQTDCVDWKIDPTPSKSNPTKIPVTLSNGVTLDVWLINAWDWSIIPQIQLEVPSLTGAPRPTPLPPALALFGSGLGLIGFLRRRAKSRSAA